MNPADGPLSDAVRPRRDPAYGVEFLRLPLGARGHVLRVGGKVYEAVAALLDRRETLAILHSV